MPAQNWIRASLKERGFKLKDAAAALNITPPRMTDILKGMREVQADEVLPLSKLVGLSSRSLLTSLASGERIDLGPDTEGATIPVIGSLTGTGELMALDEDERITSVPMPPDAESHEGLYCYRMGDDSLDQEIRKGSLIIAGDPRIHFFPMVPGSIFILRIDDERVTARQYFRSDTGEDWLVPLPKNHNPMYESWRYSILPGDLDPTASRTSTTATASAGHRIFRVDDIIAVVMWVHRRHAPEQD